MVTNNGGIDKIESAADISLNVMVPESQTGDGEGSKMLTGIPISSVDRTKEVDITEIRESTLESNGYSVNSISYDGSLSFMGHKVRNQNGETFKISDLVYDSNGVPRPFEIRIKHETDNTKDIIKDVLVTSDSYSVNSEEETETSYDFIAMGLEENVPVTN